VQSAKISFNFGPIKTSNSLPKYFCSRETELHLIFILSLSVEFKAKMNQISRKKIFECRSFFVNEAKQGSEKEGKISRTLIYNLILKVFSAQNLA